MTRIRDHHSTIPRDSNGEHIRVLPDLVRTWRNGKRGGFPNRCSDGLVGSIPTVRTPNGSREKPTSKALGCAELR